MSNLTSVGIAAGVPNSGTGTVSTIDALMADGGQVTIGAQADAAVAAGAVGTVSSKLRAISRDIGSLVTGTVLAAGSAAIGSVTISNANANGQVAMAASAPVVIANNQSDLPIKPGSTETAATGVTIGTSGVGYLGWLSSIALLLSNALKVTLTAATSGGLSRSRTIIANNTAIVVKSGAGQLYKIRATNNSGTINYIHLFDAISATAGSGTPVDTVMIPANSSGGAGIVDTTDLGVVHATGITYCVTTGIADTDPSAPTANALVVTMYFK